MIGTPTTIAALVDSAATDAERRTGHLAQPDRTRRPRLASWTQLSFLLRRR